MSSVQTSVFILYILQHTNLITLPCLIFHHSTQTKGQKRCFTFLTVALDQCKLTVSPAYYFSTTPRTNWIEGRLGLNVTLYKVAFRKLNFAPSSPPKQHKGQILNKNCKMFIANLNIKQQTKRYKLINFTLNLCNMFLKQCHTHCSHMSAVLHNILHDIQLNTENNSSGSTIDIVSSQLIMIKLYVSHLFSLST